MVRHFSLDVLSKSKTKLPCQVKFGASHESVVPPSQLSFPEDPNQTTVNTSRDDADLRAKYVALHNAATQHIKKEYSKLQGTIQARISCLDELFSYGDGFAQGAGIIVETEAYIQACKVVFDKSYAQRLTWRKLLCRRFTVIELGKIHKDPNLSAFSNLALNVDTKVDYLKATERLQNECLSRLEDDKIDVVKVLELWETGRELFRDGAELPAFEAFTPIKENSVYVSAWT